MGCEVIPINCYPNGIFPRDAEPIETNLSELMRTVKETGADLGIAHDGDADRMMAVDELGRFISGDKLLAVLAQESGAKEIVTTIDASMSKAVILTAGEGTRMHPLTYTRSKGMLPVANKPILEHIVIEMQKSGICEFVFIVGFHAEQISGYFGDGRKWGVNIRYQNQKEHLGTADALRYAEGLINENFLMANGDAIINHHDITNLTGRTGNVLGVIELQDVSSFGVIDVKEGQIVRICEKIQNPPSHMVNAGLYLFTPEIFEAIKKQPNQNVENSR